MKSVFVVESGSKAELEKAVKSDDALNRGSIMFRDGSNFGRPGIFYLIYDGTEQAVKAISGMAKRAENEKEIIKAVEEEEERAAQGFGNILF